MTEDRKVLTSAEQELEPHKTPISSSELNLALVLKDSGQMEEAAINANADR
jgi:hypothetical protein